MVLFAVSDLLALDDCLQIEHLEPQAVHFVLDAPIEQLFIEKIVSNPTQNVERTEIGFQEMYMEAIEFRGVRNNVPPCRIFVGGIELSESRDQAGVVLRCAMKDDVQVEGGDGGAFEDGGDATDDHEVDLMPTQGAEDVEKAELAGHF